MAVDPGLRRGTLGSTQRKPGRCSTGCPAVPLGRAGTADGAAAVALFLLSTDSAFVTGSQYAVDGGMMTR